MQTLKMMGHKLLTQQLSGYAPYIIMIAIAAGYNLLLWPFIIDDAYITFAYSKNLSEGYGLVFRPEADVEATSSFLWALILGCASFLLLDAPVWAKILGLIFSIATITSVYRLFEAEAVGVLRKCMLATVAAVPASFAVWSNYGMENALLAFLCMIAIMYLPQANQLMAQLFVSVVLVSIWMSRPEGFGYVATIVGAELVRRFSLNTLSRNFLNVPLCVLGVAAFYEIFGFLYYGTILPDAALAKTAYPLLNRAFAGIRYSFGHAWAAWPVFVALILALVSIIMGNKSWRSMLANGPVFLGLALAAATICYVVAVGGDWMPAARFYAFIIPFCSAYVAGLIFNRAISKSTTIDVVFILAFVMSQVGAIAVAHKYMAKLQKAEDNALTQMVSDLNSHAQRGSTLALSDVGRASYGFNGFVFDWWGLASRLVRQRNEQMGSISAETIMEINPDYLVVYSNTQEGPKLSDPPRGMTRSSLNLVADRNLMKNYCRLKAYYFWEDRWHILLERRDIRKVDQGLAKGELERTEKCVDPVYEYR